MRAVTGTLLTGRHTGHALRARQLRARRLHRRRRARPAGAAAGHPHGRALAEGARLRHRGGRQVGTRRAGIDGRADAAGLRFVLRLSRSEAGAQLTIRRTSGGTRTAFPLRERSTSRRIRSSTGDPNDPAVYEKYRGTDYAIDAMTRRSGRWSAREKAEPFFLYFAPTIPHLALQVPQAALKEYEGEFPETPYLGDRQLPAASHAARRVCGDDHVPRCTGRPDPRYAAARPAPTSARSCSSRATTAPRSTSAARDPLFFDSDGALRGHKTNLYEGGIRVPMIARWPGHITRRRDVRITSARTGTCGRPSRISPARPRRKQTDGISIVPTLLGRSGQRAARRALLGVPLQRQLTGGADGTLERHSDEHPEKAGRGHRALRSRPRSERNHRRRRRSPRHRPAHRRSDASTDAVGD